MKYGEMNKSIADLNEAISELNDSFESSMIDFNNKLQQDFSLIHDAIFKYFVYQTSFIKNTEYDANNILSALEEKKIRETVKTSQHVRNINELVFTSVLESYRFD